MKLFHKIFLCFVVVFSITFHAAGYLLINYSYQNVMEQEKKIAFQDYLHNRDILQSILYTDEEFFLKNTENYGLIYENVLRNFTVPLNLYSMDNEWGNVIGIDQDLLTMRSSTGRYVTDWRSLYIREEGQGLTIFEGKFFEGNEENVAFHVLNKNGKKYAPTYLRTINNQLNAMFNHAERYYDLQRNPAKKAGNMGKSKANAMQIWTTDEYRRFLECVANKPISFYAFEILYWTGIREGEMLALTMEDFDFKTNTLRINKNLYRHGGEIYITDPKTDKSIRNIKIPQFLADEMKEYFKSLYHLKPTDRIFSISKNYLYYEMKRGCKASGVKRIRIHDLRHSHCSLLIQKGYTVVAIADRLGHESIEITYMYAHLFPSVQSEMANDLNNEKELMYHVS